MLLAGIIADDVFAGDDAGEFTQIVYHRDEVLVHGALHQFFHADGDAHGGIVVASEEEKREESN